jgi:NAD(P)-dependent dehydrogenase (short-subunit alcohol dehydrogenase family)
MLDLTNKVALITGLGQTSGSGWGIGAACAFQLAKQGAKVFGGNRSLKSAETTRDLIRQAGGVCDVMVTDAKNAESVKALVDACIQQHGRIDILVNNVGRSEPGCPATMSEATWDAQMEINLKSVYLTCHYVLPIMEAQKSGSIVSIGSIAGLRSAHPRWLRTSSQDSRAAIHWQSADCVQRGQSRFAPVHVSDGCHLC